MSFPHQPQPVKYFLGLIYNCQVSLWDLERVLQSKFDFIDRKSPVLEFDGFTDYYQKEMGHNLYRTWWSLHRLQSPDRLAEFKLLANELEDQYSREAESEGRTVNIDPGYINESRLVLASCKDFSHRIHLAKGVFAETTLIYKGDGFQPLEWTYPDYQSPEALKYFETLKQDYRSQLKGDK
jgi:hypothetical protein